MVDASDVYPERKAGGDALLRDSGCHPDISQKMLTVTLKNLEADGLVRREAFAEIPPRVEYSITERGKSLMPHINSLIDWALNNLAAIMNDRKKYNTK